MSTTILHRAKIIPFILAAASAVLLSCCQLPPVITEADFSVSIMSFNLRYDNEDDGLNRWDNRKEAAVSLIETYVPSVFGIQEGLAHQVEYLSENLNQYSSIGVGRDDGENDGEFNSVYWLKDQFELLGSGTFWLSETPDFPSYGWDAACRRVVSWVYLQPRDGSDSFYLFNTHFDHEGAEARTKSSILLMEKIEEKTEEDAIVYITGDFNSLFIDPILTPLKENFYSAKHTAVKSDNSSSYNAFGCFFMFRTIDFIFYKNANARSYRTVNDDFGPSYISDHYPIYAEFTQ